MEGGDPAYRTGARVNDWKWRLYSVHFVKNVVFLQELGFQLMVTFAAYMILGV